MARRTGVALATLVALAVAAPAAEAAAAGDALNAYRVAPSVENKRELVQAGFDLIEGDKGSYLEIYACLLYTSPSPRDRS